MWEASVIARYSNPSLEASMDELMFWNIVHGGSKALHM
jgi:hypothetical protein